MWPQSVSVISVHTENFDQVIQAGKIFKNSGAEDICTTDESSAKENSASEHALCPSQAAHSHARA
jgi:hypothetical protein